MTPALAILAAEHRLRSDTGRADRVLDARGRLVALDGGSLVYDIALSRFVRQSLADWQQKQVGRYRF